MLRSQGFFPSERSNTVSAWEKYLCISFITFFSCVRKLFMKNQLYFATYFSCAAQADPSLSFQSKTSPLQWKQVTWIIISLLSKTSNHLVRALVHREVKEPGLGQLLRSHLQLSWPGGELGKSCRFFLELGI